MVVTGQLHDPAVSLPGKGPALPIRQEAEWAPETVWTLRRKEKSLRTPAVEPVARRYTD
jgi:hypothetical protein